MSTYTAPTDSLQHQPTTRLGQMPRQLPIHLAQHAGHLRQQRQGRGGEGEQKVVLPVRDSQEGGFEGRHIVVAVLCAGYHVRWQRNGNVRVMEYTSAHAIGKRHDMYGKRRRKVNDTTSHAYTQMAGNTQTSMPAHERDGETAKHQ